MTFLPVGGSGNLTQCFVVSVQADKYVEENETFSLVMSSSDVAVELTNTIAAITITDNDSKCK